MTSFDHRLGFPPALLAFESEPRKPQRTPPVQKLSEAEQTERRLLDTKLTWQGAEAPKKAASAAASEVYFYVYSIEYNRYRRFKEGISEYWTVDEKKWCPSALPPSSISRLLTEGRLVFVTTGPWEK